MSLRSGLAFLLMLPAAAVGQSQPSLASIVRLAPGAFTSVPSEVRKTLESRRCLIPQTSDAKAPENVVHGAFTSARANEWAVLCSVADTARILILQRSSHADVRVVDSLGPGSDLGCMQGIGDGKWGYSCLLQLRPQRTIRSWNREVHSRIDHDAIERVFVGKAAVAYYFANGRWHQFVTGD